ncbi:MAG TPA: NADH-quinone oxidoreductase subunit N [Acidimicrobiales bacterium]|nr:NADH-quinone oxidoreductase subunit N [Acidimicrobiales bacterium]
MSALLAATTSTGHVVLPHIAYFAIMPVLVMLGGAVVILVASSLSRRPLDLSATTSLTLLTSSVAFAFGLVQWFDVLHHGPHATIDNSVVQDGFSAFFTMTVTAAVLVATMVGDSWLRRQGVFGPEYHVLTLVSASGAIIMASANDLIIVFLGLEILSIALYVLAAMNSRRAESGEAALKYFVLGAFSSAVFLYGIALVYGSTGTTNLLQIADYLARNVPLHNGLLLAGLALLLVGFGFKVAAVPFHLWTPDVYQGSPTPVAGFMAAVAKAGGFAALLRVFVSSFGLLRDDWRPAVWVLAALTLLLGAVVALVQRDVKRMLAYSSINTAGFILLGLQAANARGVESSLYYLFVYTFMVIGSFAVVSVVGGAGDDRHGLERYRGLAARQPWLAAALALFLLAQAGIPFTTGFLAKLEVITAAVGAHSTALAVIAMVTAAIAAFFYLRVVVVMYAPLADTAPDDTPEQLEAAYGVEPEASPPAPAPVLAGAASPGGRGEEGAITVPAPSAAAPAAAPDDANRDLVGLHVPLGAASTIVVCAGITVLFGLWPAPIVEFAHKATLLFI